MNSRITGIEIQGQKIDKLRFALQGANKNELEDALHRINQILVLKEMKMKINKSNTKVFVRNRSV